MDDDGVIINVEDDGRDIPVTDAAGNVLHIEHSDGSVTISTDGRGLGSVEPPKEDRGWFSNLAEELHGNELGRISSDLLRGIEEDLTSSREWREERALGIRLLGLKIELPGQQSAADGAPVEGMSKIRHPLLLEAVLRCQANARSELLPTDGPVKVHDDADTSSSDRDSMAEGLEKLANHYLVSTASEYYPDTDRMLLLWGFGGSTFKKVYFCPMRCRPVSETVDADDLIVNNSATDLRNAKRITHRISMPPNDVKRLQILGVYRQIDLGTPRPADLDAVQREKKDQQGVSESGSRPEDDDREVYECYSELDIVGHEHKMRGKITGLRLPYRVTIDKTTREVLSLVRNYDKPEEGRLPEAKIPFVKYQFVPGFGFYDIGLVHILGNTTNALTAGWRELLDAGMYANFPSFLVSKLGSRQNSMILRASPGSGVQIDTNGLPISDVVMPTPYNMQSAPSLMALIESMAQTGGRVGGVSEIQVGEGRADMPVGTILAIIEQAGKVLNAVHKRAHTAQAEEFRLLFECIREHPGDFLDAVRRGRKKTFDSWTEDSLRQALDDYELTPQADPNTSSHVERVIKYLMLLTLATQFPTIYDVVAINKAVLAHIVKLPAGDSFLAPVQSMGRPTPDQQAKSAEAQKMQAEAQAKLIMAQAKTHEIAAKTTEMLSGEMRENRKREPESQETPIQHRVSVEQMEAEAKLLDAKSRARSVDVNRADTLLDDANAAEDRKSREQLELLQLAKELVLHPQEAPLVKDVTSGAGKKKD